MNLKLKRPEQFLTDVRKHIRTSLDKVGPQDPGDIQALMIVDAARDLVRAEGWFKFLVERL